ncbi:GNAT family N-acetyltransferase [Streptomyces cacaoi]|uniref:N-acetyltransferase domain-containing protein n=1 Tax=Streptomyces cacaoi TaxID=1898 RepID=A0A4Y3R1X0_STRCI|nr:GNAT family N-acetyltransferase [Streptomyces cacaoi]NNG87312.1 GNAT family N-acetyltransferase [Streptomyces cacaoi]GEB51715.1 hypothetical protein SCA03_42660 [Streptomyces cacaoi]
MEELRNLSDVVRASGDDALAVWAAQGREAHDCLGTGVRAWREGTAVAVASPHLSARDRLALTGHRADAARLLPRVLAETGPGYRLVADARLADPVLTDVPGLEPLHVFHWMDTTAPPPPGPAADGGARWLDAEAAKRATRLFDDHFPDSYAQPGRDGVHRWAGVPAGHGAGGEAAPLAVAADAWSAAGCGFLAGVVTDPVARGRGLARAVCAFVLDALVGRYGRAALMVDTDNVPARAVYTSLGMTHRPLRAARHKDDPA